MKAQLLLQEGPYDLHLISYDSYLGKFPNELRIGSTEEASSLEPSEFEAAIYRKGEIEKFPMKGGNMRFGNYVYLGMRKSAFSLVNVWMS